MHAQRKLNANAQQRKFYSGGCEGVATVAQPRVDPSPGLTIDNVVYKGKKRQNTVCVRLLRR